MIVVAMRKLVLVMLLGGALIFLACPKNEPELNRPAGQETATPMPPPAELLSTVHMADPRGAVQLLAGFYDVEQGVWRWTKKVFSVALKPPPPLPDQPVTLELRLTVPEVSIRQLQTLTLSATVNGVPVGAETFDKPGDYAFTKPVPAEALDQEIAKVEFRLDNAIAAGEIETRELGLVASSVALK